MTKYERIKALCKDRGVTITGLEKELGFARGSLSKIDKNKPSYERLAKLANYFGVPIDYFSDDVPTSGQDESYYLYDEARENLRFLNENPEYKVLLSSSRKLKPEDLDIIKAMIERMS